MAEDKVTRKLTTILAADVEGYTRLMRADEEATLKTLGEYRGKEKPRRSGVGWSQSCVARS